MKKLHWLVIKSFIGPFVVTFFISLFLFLMQFLWRYIGDLVGKGLEWYVILEFIFYSSAYLIPMALPLAVLLSSIMTFGNLGEQYELVAVKSAGISLLKFMRPMFFVLGLLALLAFYSTNILIPKANLSWGALLYDVTHKKPAFNIRDGVFFKDIEGYAIRVGKKHEDNQTIENILIYAATETRGSYDVILAQKGHMEITPDERYLILELENGIQYQEMTGQKNYAHSFPNNTMQFKKYRMAIDMVALQFKRTKKELFKEDYRMLNILELDVRIDSLLRELRQRNTYLKSYLTPYFHFPDTHSVAIIPGRIVSTRENLGDFSPYLKSYRKPPPVYADSRSVGSKDDINIVPPKEFIPVNPDLTQQQLNREKILEEAMRTNRTLQSIVAGQRDENNMILDLLNKYSAEWHKKFTLAVSCILLFFIGAPLGSIIRKGGFGLPLVISILMFIVYFVINVIGEKLAKEGLISVFTGMWLSTFILLPLACILTYKASTDSKLFDSDSYKRLFRNISAALRISK